MVCQAILLFLKKNSGKYISLCAYQSERRLTRSESKNLSVDGQYAEVKV